MSSFCPKNHVLMEAAFAGKQELRRCDKCQTLIPSQKAFSCVQCSYDHCRQCIQQFESPLVSGYQKISTQIVNAHGGSHIHHSPPVYTSKLALCKNGHQMKKGRSENNQVKCDVCQGDIQPSLSSYCDLCNFDVCPKCVKT